MFPGDIWTIVVPFIAIGLLIRVVTLVVKVKAARRIARDAGMDTGNATTVALTTDDGLESTYLAANLRNQGTTAQASSSDKSAADRLRELENLQKDGLITSSEYFERRQAILKEL